MVWTLVYIIMTQAAGGTIEMATWPTELSFQSQQACVVAANDAAPGLTKGESSYAGPNPGISMSNPNAITIQPACFPAAK